MRLGPVSIAALTVITLFTSGCLTQFTANQADGLSKIEVTEDAVTANNPETGVTADAVSESAIENKIESEEEKTLSDIVKLYEEALDAIENGDYSLAEARFDSAAVLSSEVDISAITDKTLALRYSATLSSIFQDYGRLYKNVDRVNQEEPLNWLDQLSETKPEDFKYGMWKDDELIEVVRKLALRSDFPLEYNEQVKKAIYFFQTVGKKDMEERISRSGRYLPMIEKILDEHDLPLDLAYIAMIESGFNARAYSRAHCSGLWQFASATGRLYGLKKNQWYDQRYDPVKSTKAAARHLSDLYKIYGDWYLVMAAYNWGPGGVNRQIKRGNTDFWTMKMPAETRNYVPSFMAAVIISKAPELFGFENIVKEEPLVFDTVEVQYTSLKAAAKCAEIDLETLKELNTELKKNYTPAGQNYLLKIPAGKKEHFLTEYAKLKKENFFPSETDTYLVQHGDSLWEMSVRFKTSVGMIQALNGMGDSTKILPGQKLRIPAPGSTVNSYPVQAKAVSADSEDDEEITYTIKNKDTLYEIALKYKVSYRDIMKWNKIKNHRTIKPGQKIIILTKR